MACNNEKVNVKFALAIAVDVLLMMEKYMGGGTRHSVFRQAKAINKYMKSNTI